MGDDLAQAGLAIFGGIVTLAIISVIVGQRSTASQAISATGSAFASVINAAVNPVSNGGTGSINGNLGANSFGAPVNSGITGLAAGLLQGGML